MTGVPSRERFRGCLVGQALGDALGFVVEGRVPEVCARYLDEGPGPGWEGNPGGFPFGQYSDDTQLARELMRSYAHLGRFDPEDYANKIRAIFSEGRIVGYGRSTAQAADRLDRGIPWDQAGTPPPSAGNGSAMRAGPIGLLFHDDLEELARAATQQGIITHGDPRCSAGAIAIAGAVSLVLSERPVEPALLLERLAELTEETEPQSAAHLRGLKRWLSFPPQKAVGFISQTGLDPEQGREQLGIPPFVVSSVLWSLYSFLTSPEDYWRTIRTAIAVGGDVDTTAAMAGAISGAHLGLAAVPRDLARRLTDRGAWGLADLIRLADECHAVRQRQA